MKIEEKLKPLSGYLISIKRNTVNGWYELQVGVPADWIYKSNDIIKCEAMRITDAGHVLTISPKKDDVIVDDLIDFVVLIINTNQKIREKEKEFTNKMYSVKKSLEDEAKEFYKQLEDLKEKSFSKFNSTNTNVSKKSEKSNTTSSNNDDEKNKKDDNVENDKITSKTTTEKRGRGRPPKRKK
jgi:hypothetical protein